MLADWQVHKSSEMEQPRQHEGRAHVPGLRATFERLALQDPHSEGASPALKAPHCGHVAFRAAVFLLVLLYKGRN